MSSSAYTWIRTRDGSPTLWSNELGESFRSTKGAFTESWVAFVEPVLKAAREGGGAVVGELGLGPGTNWILATLAFRAAGIPLRYAVVERDPGSFRAGLERWREEGPALLAFLASKGLAIEGEAPIRAALAEGTRALAGDPSDAFAIFPDFASAAGTRADFWFHDPFGFEVNPDGYSVQTLREASGLWAPRGRGFSYACNRRFQDALAEAIPGILVRVVATGDAGLKRERMEFEWHR